MMYLVYTANLGHEQINHLGATQTLFFESNLADSYPTSCSDATGAHTTQMNSENPTSSV